MTERDNNRIQILNYKDGRNIRTIGNSGDVRLNKPLGFALDYTGKIIVADSTRLLVYQYNDGSYIKTFSNKLNNPYGVTIGNGFIVMSQGITISNDKKNPFNYFWDKNINDNNYIEVFKYNKIFDDANIAQTKGIISNPNESVINTIGTVSASNGTVAKFEGIVKLSYPMLLAFDNNGKIAIADKMHN